MLKQHLKAAKLALKLQQPRQLLDIVKGMLHASQTTPLTHKGYIAQLAPFAKSLSQSDMQNVFTYIRDWNTSPKNCACAQALLGAVLATHGPKVLNSMSVQRTPYSESCMTRCDRLCCALYRSPCAGHCICARPSRDLRSSFAIFREAL